MYVIHPRRIKLLLLSAPDSDCNGQKMWTLMLKYFHLQETSCSILNGHFPLVKLINEHCKENYEQDVSVFVH